MSSWKVSSLQVQITSLECEHNCFTLVHEQNHTRKELTGDRKAKERGNKCIAIGMETHTLEWEGNCSNIEDERADPLCRWLESITQPNSWFFPHPGTTYWNRANMKTLATKNPIAKQLESSSLKAERFRARSVYHFASAAKQPKQLSAKMTINPPFIHTQQKTCFISMKIPAK